MIDKAKLIEMLEKQKEIEMKTAILAKKIVEDAESPVVHQLVSGIGFDSMKHQIYCQILIDICLGKKFLGNECVGILKLIKTLNRLAEDMILHLQQIIRETDHPDIKLLLREYEMDEKRHQTMIKQLIEQLIRDKFPEEISRHIYSPATIIVHHIGCT